MNKIKENIILKLKEKNLIKDDNNIDYKIFFYSKLEDYPLLLSNDVDINAKNEFGFNLLFNLKDISKLEFCLKNGIDRVNTNTKNKSPYKSADLEITKLFLKYKIPCQSKEDFSSSYVVQEYLREKKIILNNNNKVTGIMLSRLTNKDFLIMLEKYKEKLEYIFLTDKNLLLNISDEELRLISESDIYIEDKQYLKESYQDIFLKKNITLNRIKYLEKIGLEFPIDEYYNNILSFKNIEIVYYILEKFNIKKDFLEKKEFNNYIYKNLDSNINIELLLETEEFLNLIEYKNELSKKYLSDIRHKLYSKLYDMKINSLKQKIDILNNDYIDSNIINKVFNSLDSKDYLIINKEIKNLEKIYEDLNPYFFIKLFLENKLKDRYIKNQESKMMISFHINNIMSKFDKIESLLSQVFSVLNKENSSLIIDELIYLDDIALLMKKQKVDSKKLTIEELNNKKTREGSYIIRKSVYVNSSQQVRGFNENLEIKERLLKEIFLLKENIKINNEFFNEKTKISKRI